uniref:Uncharacterized protein n=1 Tax=Methylophaga nitratireducenticrescens TaxID=754476 RepID=I1XIQ1_METNJ
MDIKLPDKLKPSEQDIQVALICPMQQNNYHLFTYHEISKAS